MATSITMPQLGESVVEGTVTRWLKREGESVSKYEPLLEVVTEKVSVEVPSPVAGVVQRLSVAEGETVPVGTEIAVVMESEVRASAPEPSPREPATVGSTAGKAAGPSMVGSAAPVISPNGQSPDESALRRYTPVVMRLAQQHQVDLEQLSGTGMGGRVTKEDLLRYLEERQAPEKPTSPPPPSPVRPLPEHVAAATADIAMAARVPAAPRPSAPERVAAGPTPSPDEEIVPLTPMRRAIAEHMTRSASTIPHAWTMVEVDVTGLVQLRGQIKGEFQLRSGVELTFLPFVIKAVAEALREQPMVNSAWGDGYIVRKRSINIGVAVARDDGLVVPVVRRADELSLAGLARACQELIGRARSGGLAVADIEGATFTVNNPGTLGSILSQPIIPEGQAAILNMESIVKRPVVRDDAIAIRSMLNLCLSFDHRILDGADAIGFLQAVRRRLEAYAPGMAL